MTVRQISRTEMAARFKPHAALLMPGSSLADAVRGCECYDLGNGVAVAMRANDPQPGELFISLAVAEQGTSGAHFLQVFLAHFAKGMKVHFESVREGWHFYLHRFGWDCYPLPVGFRFSKVF